MNSIKTNKHIFKKFSPSNIQTIIVFPYRKSWQYSDGYLSNGGFKCRSGRHKSRFWTNSWLSIDDCWS